MKSNHFILLLILASVSLFSCTGNDLFDDEVKLTNDTIHGTVKYDDQTDHSGIYVWCELTDKGTYTDKDGNFSFTLSSNNKDKGFANFKFYFYSNDYVLQKDSVEIRDGKFQFGVGKLDDTGKLKSSYTINKLFTVEQIPDTNLPKFTEIYPHIWYKIKFKKPGYVSVPISNSYQIGFPVYYETSSFLYFNNNSVPEKNEKIREWKIFGSDSQNEEVYFMLNLSDFVTKGIPYGDYSILLFILGNEGGIPTELLNNIVSDRMLIDNYLKQPNKVIKIPFTYQAPG